ASRGSRKGASRSPGGTSTGSASCSSWAPSRRGRRDAMSATNETPTDQLSLRALQDRIAVTDVLYRYSSAIDSFDHEGVRSVLADDVHAQYGNLDPVSGGDALAEWISGATAAITWQHHQLSVYHVDVDGDQASALSYLTSHQVFDGEPNV